MIKKFAPTSERIPRGVRNNNPLNIRHNPANDWQGMTGVDDAGFVMFDNISNGYRAAGKILDSYARRGIITVDDIISTWAPASENDTEAYINYVQSTTGIGDFPVTNVFKALMLQRMAEYENGAENITVELNFIRSAIA